VSTDRPVPGASVRLTEPAVEDLVGLATAAPSVVRWALKKMLLLEESPYAGEALLGGLVGWRKLTVGDRNRRVVWRVAKATDGTTLIEVAEVWAVGARSDSAVYDEMTSRVASLPQERTVALADAVAQLGRVAAGIVPASPPASDPVPAWLVDRLVQTAKLDPGAVWAMSLEEAVDAWSEWTNKPR
jgi:mRNA interferase RelE/StbE